MIIKTQKEIENRFAHLAREEVARLVVISRVARVMHQRTRLPKKRVGALIELCRCKTMWKEITGEWL